LTALSRLLGQLTRRPLAEGEISELHVGLKGTMNALFLKDLAAKTHRDLRGRVEDGKSGGGLCYGYLQLSPFSFAQAAIESVRASTAFHATDPVLRCVAPSTSTQATQKKRMQQSKNSVC
jgi:hypothetical protein